MTDFHDVDDDDDDDVGVGYVIVWRSITQGCELTNDGVTVQLANTPCDSKQSSCDSVVCMSASASVRSGHSISFHLSHTHNAAAADKPLLLSENDGVGLSVSDNVNMDTDDVIFYSFHGNSHRFSG